MTNSVERCPGCGWLSSRLVFHHWPACSGKQEAAAKGQYAYVCTGCNNVLSRLFPGVGEVSWCEQLKLLHKYHRRLAKLAKVLQNRDRPNYCESTQCMLEALQRGYRKGLSTTDLDRLYREHVERNPEIEADLLPSGPDKLTRAEKRRGDLATVLQTYEPSLIREIELAIKFQVPLEILRHEVREIRRGLSQ